MSSWVEEKIDCWNGVPFWSSVKGDWQEEQNMYLRGGGGGKKKKKWGGGGGAKRREKERGEGV